MDRSTRVNLLFQMAGPGPEDVAQRLEAWLSLTIQSRIISQTALLRQTGAMVPSLRTAVARKRPGVIYSTPEGELFSLSVPVLIALLIGVMKLAWRGIKTDSCLDGLTASGRRIQRQPENL